MSDAQERYQLIAGAFDARVQAVSPEKWDLQSPCEEWKARDVVAHVVGGHRRAIAQIQGGEAQTVGPNEDPAAAWDDAYATMRQLSADPAVLATSVQGPTGELPFGEVLGRFVCMDTLVHTWDLARAVGGDERLDEDSVGRTFEALKPMDAMIRQPGVFGPRLEPPPGADTQTELLYFLGRQA